MKKLLLADIDDDLNLLTQKYFENKDIEIHTAKNNTHCKEELENNHFNAVIINLSHKNEDALGVLKTMTTVSPSTKVILSFDNDIDIQESERHREELKQIGIKSFLNKPYTMSDLETCLEQKEYTEDWHSIKFQSYIQINDSEFTSIPIETFHDEHVFIIDVYIKLSPHKYLKILHAGDSMEESRVKRYEFGKKLTHFYFKNEEKEKYIKFASQVLESLTKSRNVIIPSQKKTPSPYIDDITAAIEHEVTQTNFEQNQLYTEVTKRSKTSSIQDFMALGKLKTIKPGYLKPSITLFLNTYYLITDHPQLNEYLYYYKNLSPLYEDHIYYTTILATTCCAQLDWGQDSILKLICKAAILHDIGLIQVDEDILQKDFDKLDYGELKQYKTHPIKSAELLQGIDIIPDKVRQIIAQHHEKLNGIGYPKSLSGMRIYPMSQVLALASEISEYTIKHTVTPKEAFKLLIRDTDFLRSFDAEVIKAMSSIFTIDKKRRKRKKKKS